MRILRIYFRLPPLQGGMEQHINILTIEQIKYKHEVSIAYSNGNPIIGANNISLLSKFNLYKIKITPFSAFFFYLVLVSKLIFVHRKNIDIVHIHGDWSSFIFSSLIKFVSKAKLITFSLHGTLRTHSSFRKKILFCTFKKADIVFSTGYETYETILPYCEKAIFQPSGVSDEFYEFHNKTGNDFFTIITVSNLVPVKNIDLILDIAILLPNYHFIIIGEGRMKVSLTQKIKDLGCSNVLLKGKLDKQSIAKELYQADVFLFTSLNEGTPTAIMEAMACGLPIVSSNAGKVESIVKNEDNGFVIHSYNALEYVEKLVFLKTNELIREQITHNNRIAAQDFKWEKVASRITNLMEECLKEKIKK